MLFQAVYVPVSLPVGAAAAAWRSSLTKRISSCFDMLVCLLRIDYHFFFFCDPLLSTWHAGWGDGTQPKKKKKRMQVRAETTTLRRQRPSGVNLMCNHRYWLFIIYNLSPHPPHKPVRASMQCDLQNCCVKTAPWLHITTKSGLMLGWTGCLLCGGQISHLPWLIFLKLEWTSQQLKHFMEEFDWYGNRLEKHPRFYQRSQLTC